MSRCGTLAALLRAHDAPTGRWPAASARADASPARPASGTRGSAATGGDGREAAAHLRVMRLFHCFRYLCAPVSNPPGVNLPVSVCGDQLNDMANAFSAFCCDASR